jgi:hypothetical protein
MTQKAIYKHKRSGDLFAIELKRGMTSDETIETHTGWPIK